VTPAKRRVDAVNHVMIILPACVTAVRSPAVTPSPLGYCIPATARASPLNSRMCMPVFARSTT